MTLVHKFYKEKKLIIHIEMPNRTFFYHSLTRNALDSSSVTAAGAVPGPELEEEMFEFLPLLERGGSANVDVSTVN